MNKSNIKLQHYGDAINTTWYWTDEDGKTISPYMGDSNIAEKWGKLYKEAVKEEIVVINGKLYNSKR